MKNRNKRPRSIFDALFGENDFFNDSFFSVRSFDFSFPKMEMNNSGLPEDGDPNFNKTEESVETGSHTIKKEVWTSIDGTQRFERTSMQSKSQPKALKEPTVEDLKLELNSAVENQEYERAIEIRDELKKRGENLK